MSRAATNFKIIKLAFTTMYDNAGNRSEVISNPILRGLPDDKKLFFYDLIDFLREGTFFKYPITMRYLFETQCTMNDLWDMVVLEAEMKGVEPMKKNSLISQIQYDRVRLDKQIGHNCLTGLLQNKFVSIDPYRMLLRDLKNSTGAGAIDLNKGLILPIPSATPVDTLDDESYQDFKNTIIPYIKSQAEFIMNSLSPEQKGYFRYLSLYGKTLTSEVDKERLSELSLILGLGAIEDKPETPKRRRGRPPKVKEEGDNPGEVSRSNVSNQNTEVTSVTSDDISNNNSIQIV